MLNKEEASRLKDIWETLANPVEIGLCQTTGSEFGLRIENFIGELRRLSQGKIQVVSGFVNAGSPINPCFTIGREGCANITYAAIPSGHQFAPFVGALERIGNGRPPGTSLQAELMVFVSGHCPRCPAAVEAAIQLSGSHASISTCIVDAEQFPDYARQYGIRSVPATVLDRRLVSVGLVPAGRLMELVQIRNTVQFEIEVVRSMIETGRIKEAAGFIGQDAGREVLLDLVQQADFSKRLSALVVIEKALEDAPDEVRSLVPSLVTMLTHTDPRIRGDIADLLGKIHDLRAVAPLESLADDPDPDVREAASDALEELRKRCG